MKKVSYFFVPFYLAVQKAQVNCLAGRLLTLLSRRKGALLSFVIIPLLSIIWRAILIDSMHYSHSKLTDNVHHCNSITILPQFTFPFQLILLLSSFQNNCSVHSRCNFNNFKILNVHKPWNFMKIEPSQLVTRIFVLERLICVQWLKKVGENLKQACFRYKNEIFLGGGWGRKGATTSGSLMLQISLSSFISQSSRNQGSALFTLLDLGSNHFFYFVQ